MKTMEDVLIEHQRQSSSACLCGWSELGRSHPGHQAEVLSAAGYGPMPEAAAEAWDEAANHANREWRIGYTSTAILKGDNPYRAAS